jgi:hypothetical protein
MTRKCLFVAALLSLALAGGCAKGGNGAGNGITIAVSDGNVTVVGVNLSVTFTATVTGTSNTAVAWTLSGSACTGNPNPCGTIDVSTGVYTAPAKVPKPSSVTITATSRADSTARGEASINIVPITVIVAPTPVNAGQGLVQQFTATAAPDATPQTFTWTCTDGGVACANFVSSNSGLAVYTAAEGTCGNGCITVSAVSTTDPNGCINNPKDCIAAEISVVTSRVSGTYALRFSGFDSAHHSVTIAGSVTFNSTGTVTGGLEDVVINGIHHQYTTVSGSFTPSVLGDNNTNNAGTLTLSASGGPTNTYAAVLDASGNVRMIEFDGSGTGSGTMEKSTPAQFNSAAQKFVFGFTGVDSNGKRVGYVGLLPLDGNGNISGGIADTNDSGATNSACATPPCTVTGTYQLAGGVWTLHLLLGSQALDFDFYIGSGQTSTNTKNPLTLYAISTDPIDPSHPTLSGRLVFQEPGTTYDKTALNSDSVSHLTGVDSTGSNTLVSLVGATGDGNGNLNEIFDANNAGTIVQAASQASPCTYATATGGRYIVTLLGSGTSCTGGMPFVLYASGANRGFLLDQSSAAVMTGAMGPQTGNGTFAPSELPSTYAIGTVSGATSGVVPMVANLLLTSPGKGVFNVGGTQYASTSGFQVQTVTGSYTLSLPGKGTIVMTAPAANYVIYATDTAHFEMIDVDKTVTNASVIFAQQ